MARFFLGYSQAGSDVSHGFANDHIVEVYSSKKERDFALAEISIHNISAIALKKNEVTEYLSNYSLTRNTYNKPRPFSNEFWGVTDYRLLNNEKREGYIGDVEVINGYTFQKAERLY